ncbi:unnamed protein product [Gadus morhua 'NCC']
MGKINGCLKCVFFLLNAVFGIFGGLMVFGLVKAQAVEPQLPSAVGHWLWVGLCVFSLGMLMVSILGGTAAKTEKTALLKCLQAGRTWKSSYHLLQPCLPIASDMLDLALTVSMGVLFGFAVTRSPLPWGKPPDDWVRSGVTTAAAEDRPSP